MSSSLQIAPDKPKVILPNGLQALWFGFKLLNRPGLRLYALMPVLVNIIIFGLGFYTAYGYVEALRGQFASWLPAWLAFISYMLWPLFIISAGVIVIYTFTLITQLIAAPFNAILSEQVEAQLGVNTATEDANIDFWQALKTAVPREISKLLKSLKWLLLMLILSFVPVLNIVVPLIGAWLIAIDYLDYPADNRGLKFEQSLQIIEGQRLQHLIFGVLVSIASFIPLVNLFVVPAAVAGGTALWHRHTEQQFAASS
ncbi:MAG: sulfate transporter CysZ [Pseudomonadales bacterium]|nr:sulfate transporter CysZ [Pseudomonadales bacterium]